MCICLYRKFIRGYKDPDEKLDKQNLKEQSRLKSRICAISGDLLQEPIVCCQLGNLYNKQSLIESLLNHTLNQAFSHIRGLKDVKELRLTINPTAALAASTAATAAAAMTAEDFPCASYICPVTSLELDGIRPFVVLWTTGQVLSQQALREVGVAGLEMVRKKQGYVLTD